MQITFDRVYQSGQGNPAWLLKDYLIPGTCLKFGRQQAKWYWEIVIPGIKHAVLPSAVTAIAEIGSDPGTFLLYHNRSYWTLFNRPFKKGPEPFSRTIESISELPLESLYTVITTDFEVYIELRAANTAVQPGLKDSAQAVMVIADNQTAAARIARWFDAEATALDPRQPASTTIYVGFSELPWLFRVPIYDDTLMPHLLAVPTDIVAHLLRYPNLLCRGMLVAGLSGSGKTTTVQRILAPILQSSQLSSLLIVDVKGEYRGFALQNNIAYLEPGKDLSSLKKLGVCPFIPLSGLRLSSHIDTLALILGIGGAGGGGFLLPSFLKLLLEEFYFAVLWPPLVKDDLPAEPFEQKLALLNMQGKELLRRLSGNWACLDRAMYQLLNFWKTSGEKVIQQMFRPGGGSNGRAEIADVLSSRMAFLATSVLAFFPYSQVASFDALTTKKVCISLHGLSKSTLQQLMSVFCLLTIEPILAGDEQNSLKHLFLIEEAHHLAGLPAVNSDMLSTEKLLGDQIERALVEGRSKGMGMILTDQQPGTRLLSCIAANTTLKVCHNMLGRDGEIMAQAMGLPDATNFSTLGVGEVYIKPGDHFPAVRTRIRL